MATIRFDTAHTNRLAALPIDVLDSLFAECLSRTVEHNDRLPSRGQITRFHSKQPPPLAIGQYLPRLTKFTPFPRDALLLAIVYLNRISHLPYKGEPNASAPIPPSPTISSVERPRAIPILNSYTLHRLVLAVLLVATKYTCDGTLGQARAAKVGGVTTSELCKLEGEVIRLLGWELGWSLHELDSVCREVERIGVEKGIVEAVDYPARETALPPSPTSSTASSFDGKTPTASHFPASPPKLSIITPPDSTSHAPSSGTSSGTSSAHSSQPSSLASSPHLFSPTTSPRGKRRSLGLFPPGATGALDEEEGESTPPSSPSAASAEGPDSAGEGKGKVGELCRSLSPKGSDETVRRLEAISLAQNE
ncbi:hypothetical protein JCM10213v2_000392 [Rhodosporidiobolus nylandii]